MKIPLEKSLRKRLHVEIGMLQDEAMDALYSIDPLLVLHGGTCVWRCFEGNRFSEDLDLYSQRGGKLAAEMADVLGSRSLALSKLKSTGNLLYCKVSDSQAEIRIEINLAASVPYGARRYERINGSFMDVLCPSPETLFLEKIAAYKNRRFARDLYDLYHLSSYVEDAPQLQKAAKGLLSALQQPLDGPNLSALVYSGAVPTFEQMALALRRKFS